MENLLDLLTLQTVALSELTVRVFLAMLFGLVIGWDRDRKNKPMDFRAYMIVAVAACIVAVMGQEVYSHYSSVEGVVTVDLAKIIGGVLTGIGFLGAGAIIHRDEQHVIGTATGASVWASGCLGMALGFGMYGLAAMAFIAVVAILIIGGIFAKPLVGKEDKEKN